MPNASRLWGPRALSLSAVLVAVLAGAGAISKLEVTTEITHFLPESDDRELAMIAREVSASELNRTVTLLVGSSDRADAMQAATLFAEDLRARPEVAWVRSGPQQGLEQVFYDLYFQRRLSFAQTDTTADALAERVRDLRRRLVGPTGAFIRRVAPEDPLLAFPRFLERVQRAEQGGLEVDGDQLMTSDGRGVIFLASRASPFASESSHAFAAAIDAGLTSVRAVHPDVRLSQSGIHRLAIASESAIRADVTRISVISAIGVVLLFVVLFRSLRYLILATVPLLVGFSASLVVCALAFGTLHGLSLAFGATLIGVAIDYVVHALNHHTLAPSQGGPSASLEKIWPGLLLGAATTIVGLAGLAWTSFPGIRELAVFTSVGVGAALLSTRYLLPPWLPERPVARPVHLALSALMGRWMTRLRSSRVGLVTVPLIALVVCAMGLMRLQWTDDVRALNTLDADLLAEDEAVRGAVSRVDSGRFVIAWGDDDEQALVRNDAVFDALSAGVEAGELERFRSVHRLLPSANAQRAQREALTSDRELWPRLVDALSEEGFVADAFEPFHAALSEPAPAALTWSDLNASGLGPLVAPFRVALDDGRVAYLTLTRGADLAALERRIAPIDGARVFDQGSFMQGAYGRFRARTLELLAAGLLAVLGLVWVRYRRLSLALAAFVPAVLAAATSLSVLVLLGDRATLMHLVALLLVLSMGVDYGVFMVESRAHEEGPAPTVVSLLLACVSTVLSFGLLAMSANPALRALGLVTGVGVGLSFVLAPLAWLIAGRPEGSQ